MTNEIRNVLYDMRATAASVRSDPERAKRGISYAPQCIEDWASRIEIAMQSGDEKNRRKSAFWKMFGWFRKRPLR